MKLESWRNLCISYIEANKNNKGIDIIGNKTYIQSDVLLKRIKKILNTNINNISNKEVLDCIVIELKQLEKELEENKNGS